MNHNKYKIFESIKSDAEKNLKNLSEWWNVCEKQRFFISAIGIYDKFFYDLHSETTQIKPFYDRIMFYSYPVFIRIFYDVKFGELPGTILQPLDEELLLLYSKIIYSCGIIGWMQSLIDNVMSGVMNCHAFGKNTWIKFNYKYHWNEFLESEYLKWYSDSVSKLQKDKYIELEKKKDSIIRKMQDSCFVWNDAYLGYINDYDVEEFFNTYALLDAQQATEWDMFPPDNTFDGIYYGDFVQTIVDFCGYAIKHTYFANMLVSKHPELFLENLYCCTILEEDMVKLIGNNERIGLTKAKKILDLITLSDKNMNYYKNTNAAPACFIKISKNHYLRSISGLLDRPFEFALSNLRNEYPKEWDKNTINREKVFRDQLYALFDKDNYICIERPVVIKDKKGKVVTDIDAVIIDKRTQELGLFQLKWQDHTGDSVFSLKSKSRNYNLKTKKWVEDTCVWLDKNSVDDIARQIGIKKRYLNKEKIYLFVFGRRHGNYSSDEKPDERYISAQWYQTLNICRYMQEKKELTISGLFKYLCDSHPTNKKIIEERTLFCYGKYRIHFGGYKRFLNLGCK